MAASSPERLICRKISNIRGSKSQNLNVCRPILQLSLRNLWKPGVMSNEDVVGAAPTGDAPTTSEWSTFLLPIMVFLTLEIWRWLLWELHIHKHPIYEVRVKFSANDRRQSNCVGYDIINWPTRSLISYLLSRVYQCCILAIFTYRWVS